MKPMEEFFEALMREDEAFERYLTLVGIKYKMADEIAEAIKAKALEVLMEIDIEEEIKAFMKREKKQIKKWVREGKQ